MAEAAVIFDVDGVLLELTRAEEDLFFVPFERRYGLKGLSRDWNSYRIRNDEKIIAEIFETHALPPAEMQQVIAEYLQLLAEGIAGGGIACPSVPGAYQLLQSLAPHARLAIATANLREAARLRLQAAGLWPHVADHAFGADGSGHKSETVGRAIADLKLPRHNIIYVGDNLNDLEAANTNGVAFIGFSTDVTRRAALAKAGARHIAGNHAETLALLRRLLSLD